MTYQENVISRIKNSDNWPGFERPNFLQELNDVADSAFNKVTIEGYLAALLIYHQLTEELIRILIDCSTFYIQLCVFPQEYIKRELRGKMFGQLIDVLKHTVNDDRQKKLVQQAKQLNSLRIIMVHKLTLKSSLTKIEMQCKKAKKLFDSIFKLFEEIYDNYRVTFSYYKKNPEDLEEAIY